MPIYFVTLTETDGDAVAVEVIDDDHLRDLIWQDQSGTLIDGHIIPLGEAQKRLCQDSSNKGSKRSSVKR